MQAVFQHPTYGNIGYEESFWSGKKTLYIPGHVVEKVDKNTFAFTEDGVKKFITLRGNFVTGAVLKIGDESFEVTKAAKWYEIALSVFLFAFYLVWGSVPALCLIFPVIGGALGGLLYAAIACANILLMKKTENVWLKMLIFLGLFVAAGVAGFIAALVMISTLA